MPIYVLHCQDCGKRYERIMKVDEKLEENPCPECDSKNIGKIISSFSDFKIMGDNGGSTPKRRKH